MVVVKSPSAPIPLELQPFGERLLDAFWVHSQRNPTKKAMICAENKSFSVTWREMWVSSLSLAAFFEQRKFKHGEAAAVVLPNCWEFLQIIAAAASKGIVVSGSSCLFTDYELQRQFADSNAKIVFTSDSSLERVLKAAKSCPSIRTIAVINTTDRSRPLAELPFGVIDYADILRIQPDLSHPKTDIDVHRDLLLLPYSSGTTGSAKGVMIGHQNFSSMMSIFVNHYETYFYQKTAPDWDWAAENLLLSLPFYHIYGVGVLMQCALRGQTGVVMTHFDKDVYCRSIQDYKIRMLFLVPPIMVLLANDQSLTQRYSLDSLEFITTGAAPASNEIIQKLHKLLPNLKSVLSAYGMTECSMACAMPVSVEEMPPNNVGRLLSNFEMKVIDPEGNELELGQAGELCIRSPTVMMGYLGKPQATAESIDDQGWYHTGDVAKIDARGYVFVIDRVKEFIKVKGYQVAPAELEDLLLSHPEIQDAAVVGILDEMSGELPVAYVVRKSDHLTEQQVKEFTARKTAPYKHLKKVEFINEIPKSAAGKILRRILRDTARQQKSKL